MKKILFIEAQTTPTFKSGMSARRSANALVADYPEKKPQALARGVFITIVCLSFFSFCFAQEDWEHKPHAFKLFSLDFGQSYDYSRILVQRVIDGDTLMLENGQRIRLIGIDTPEVHISDKLYRDAKRTKKDINTIQAQGELAYQFTRNLVEGKVVNIQFDVEHYDKFGRLLGYVYLEDGTFVNAKIIEEGFAQVMSIPPNVKYQDLFLNLQKEARQASRGLWKE